MPGDNPCNALLRLPETAKLQGQPEQGRHDTGRTVMAARGHDKAAFGRASGGIPAECPPSSIRTTEGLGTPAVSPARFSVAAYRVPNKKALNGWQVPQSCRLRDVPLLFAFTRALWLQWQLLARPNGRETMNGMPAFFKKYAAFLRQRPPPWRAAPSPFLLRIFCAVTHVCSFLSALFCFMFTAFAARCAFVCRAGKKAPRAPACRPAHRVHGIT